MKVIVSIYFSAKYYCSAVLIIMMPYIVNNDVLLYIEQINTS